MPPKSASPPSDLQDAKNFDIDELLNYAIRTQTLLSQLLESIYATKSPEASKITKDQKKLNPLHILRDSGKLLKAHTTKMSLMIINKPFGAKSINLELRKSVEECIMGMMGAVDIMASGWEFKEDKDSDIKSGTRSVWGDSMVKEACARVGRVMREFSTLVQELRSVTEREAGGDGVSADTATSRDSLVSTGVVWEACDALVELEKVGVVGVAVQKAQQYQQTLKDAIAELKEWAEEADNEEDDFEDDEEFSDDDDEFKDIFGTTKKLPKDDTALRSQLDRTTKKLQMISVLFQALLKRRIKPFTFAFPPEPSNESLLLKRMQDLDNLLGILKTIPETVDDLACAFYELDGPTADLSLKGCIDDSRSAVDLVHSSWDGREDEFTTWGAKWKDAILS